MVIKVITTAVLLSFRICLTASGQLLLNAGDTYTLNFTLNNVQMFVPGLGGPSYIAPAISGFSEGDVVRIRGWEDNTSQTASCDYQYGLGSCAVPFGWADGRGVVQLDVLQGTITLDSIRIHSEPTFGIGAPFVHNVMDTTFVPVPEPAVSLLLGAVVCVGGVWRRLNRRS
jgi:hypothetical protein